MTYGIQEVCTNNRLKLVLSVGCSIIAVGSSDDGDESAGVIAVVSMYKLLRMKSKNADSDAETEVDAVSVSNTSNNNQSMNSSPT